MTEKAWKWQNTMEPEELSKHYVSNGTWERAKFWYGNWRLTTALIDPPPAWEEVNLRMKLALCAVFEGGRFHEQDREKDNQ